MKAFRGFRDSETFTSIPDSLFRDLLGNIKGAGEFKVVLHALWTVQHMQGKSGGLAAQDFVAAPLGLTLPQVRLALGKATELGILLRAGRGGSARYFVNSPSGRAAAARVTDGRARNGTERAFSPTERSNLFKVYEENIGPLTPLIADALKDAADAFPEEWILEAIELAVKNNKRSWSYCEAILKRWKEDGRGQKQNRRDDQAARQRDVEKKIRKFIGG